MRQAKAIVGLAGAILAIGAAPASADITPVGMWPSDTTPVGMWPFNEGKGMVAHDYSGHHNDGTLEGPEWAQGRFQEGLNFNGNAAAVRVGDSASLDPASVSVSAWVKSNPSPGSYKYIVAKGANDCQGASYGLYTGANGGLEFFVSPDQGVSYTPSPDAGQSVWNGEWHNVVGTYDGANVRLYVDGQQVGSGTPDTAPIGYGPVGSSALTIGDYAGCPSLSLDFSGAIDEVKIFNRALASWEIGLGNHFSRWLPSSFPFDLIL